MRKTGFNNYVYDFSVDCNATNVDHILDIHKYLLKKKKRSVNKNVWICFCRINNLIKFYEGKFVDLYINEKSRV